MNTLFYLSREREAINVERMVQYDVLKARWKTELEHVLSRDSSCSDELDRLLHPSYFINNNVGNENHRTRTEENYPIEKQQLVFLKVEAQVRY